MAIKVEDQTLPVSELFKKYDLDEISELLVNLKKEVFTRTNDIKKVIGSNPELMIEFGENVLNIYNTSKALSSSVNIVMNDIEMFSGSLEEELSEISKVELPNEIICDEIFDKSQELIQEEYLNILEEFSKKKFVLAYELYLKLRENDIYNKENYPVNIASELETRFGLDCFKYNLDFIKKSIESHCYSFIQSCCDLDGTELSQLIIIKFLFESERNNDLVINNNICNKFKEVIENSITLRTKETKEDLINITLHTDTGNLECEENYEYFITGIQTLIGFYELSDSLCNVITEFENNNWINSEVKAKLFEVINVNRAIFYENTYLNELKRTIIDKFSSIGSYSSSDNNEFSYKILIKIYSNIYDGVVSNKKSMEFISNNLFPILLSDIDYCLKLFMKKNQKNQLLKLLIFSDGSQGNINQQINGKSDYNKTQSCISDCIDQKGEFPSCFNKIGNLSYYNTETFNWLCLKRKDIEFLTNEFVEIKLFLDKVLNSNELINNTMSYLSYSCFLYSINNYICFCKNLLWSFFRLNNIKKTPKSVKSNSEKNFMDELNNFTNTLIQGKCLDIIETGLQSYLGCNNEEENDKLKIIKGNVMLQLDNNSEDDNKLQYYSFQSVISNIKYDESFDIKWKTLLDITCEILVSIDYYVNSEHYNDEILESFVLLESLNTFFKLHIDKELMKTHIEKLKRLEMIIYSVILHSDKLNGKTIVFQSILNNFDVNDDCEKSIKLSEIKSKMISYYSLYRTCNIKSNGFNEKEDNYDIFTTTPHSILIEITTDIILFGMQLQSRIQRTDYNIVCKYYLYTYIIPLLYDNIHFFSNLLSQHYYHEKEYNSVINLNNCNEDNKYLDIAITLKKIIFSLFSDLTWCSNFNINDISTDEVICKNNIDNYNACIEIIEKSMNNCDFNDNNTNKFKVSKVLDTIKNDAINLLNDVQKTHNFESNIDKDNTLTNNIFATFVQRFQTSSHTRPSKYGSVSNFIATAYDKDLKIDIDRNSISKEIRNISSNFNQDVSSTNFTLENHSDVPIMTHFSELLSKYKENETSFIRSDSNINNLFANQPFSEHKTGQSTGGIHNNLNDDRISGIMNININGKIDTRSIWQVSNLLKETVKDKVFGQREDM
ncbi:hypothetical protein RS030_162528 [Cryptosporidium xiaoi]|uniref:Uncharacterized protein n=1 Tax=Cryptosporidium xiaoi TaxID=659607 RepID=A0AAV9Y365_9CRYT